MLQAGEQDPVLLQPEQVVLDLDDARHRVRGVAEEFQAHGAHMCRHAVHDPARAGDEAVAAFLLDAGQAGEEFVGDVLAQAFLAEAAAGDVEPFGAFELRPRGVEIAQLEAGQVDVVDLAQVVVQPRHLEPFGLGRDHAPDARLSSAVPHSTAFLPPAFIATLPPMQQASAEVGSTAKTWPPRSAASATRCVTTPASREDGRHRLGDAGQAHHLHLAQRLELFGIDDGALPGQRHGAAGVAGAAAARDDGQAEFDAALDERRPSRLRCPG